MTGQPRTEAGTSLLNHLRDLFASWESLAEYHNISTNELMDPAGFIAAIEAEARATAGAVEPPAGDFLTLRADWRHAKWCLWERGSETQCNCGLNAYRRSVMPQVGPAEAEDGGT